MTTATVLLREIARAEGMAAPVDASFRDLIRMMERNGQGVVALVEGKAPVGILTERDVVELLVRGIDLDGRADSHCRKPLILSAGDRSIGIALDLMVENNIRRLVVVDESGAFLGIVTQIDLLRHLEEDFYRSTLKVKHVFGRFRPLVAAERRNTIRDVLRMMVDHGISAVPVLESGAPAGIVTEKDVIRLARGGVPLDGGIESHMSSPVVCADMETSLSDVVATMTGRNINRIVVTGADGKAIGIVTNRDLVRNLEGDYATFLKRKLRQAKDFLNQLPEMLLEVVDEGTAQHVIWANERTLARFGPTILDKPATDLIPGNAWETIRAALAGGGKAEAVRFEAAGRLYECSGFYIPLERVSERGRIQLIVRDVTEDVMMAMTDGLTGIYNRRFLGEFLAKETERSLRTNKKYALILADLDHFKIVNDTHGHQAGDLVLKAVVAAIGSQIRQYDVAGRYGGEEFLIILPEIRNGRIAEGVAERIRRAIESRRVELADRETARVTASLGVAFFGEDGVSADELLQCVDQRLYQAKREGRNRVVAR